VQVVSDCQVVVFGWAVVVFDYLVVESGHQFFVE